jgi:SAM-dependent methyltransferase
MNYDILKAKINNLIKKSSTVRRFFYCMLDIFILRQVYVKSTIKKYLVAESHALFYDAGSGFCQYTDFVLGRYKDISVHASDLKADFLHDYAHSLKTSHQTRLSYAQADLTIYTLPSKNADMVVAIDILEHIIGDMEVLKNFYESMRPGGILIIHTPSDFDDSASYTAEHVRNGYSIKELSEKLSNAGFYEVESKYTYGFWGHLQWKLAMKNSMWLASSKLRIMVLPVHLIVIAIPCLLFKYLDFYRKNATGKGILFVAKRRTL